MSQTNELFFKARYSDAYRMARALITAARIAKSAAACLGFIALVLAIYLFSSYGIEGPVLGVVVLLWGVSMAGGAYVVGMLLGGLGQTLVALLDTAINTSPLIPEEQNAALITAL